MIKKDLKIKEPLSKGVAKVPVILQLEALECGAACLTMIMAYYNKWVPLEIVRKDCGISRDGSNAANIYKAALSYGLECDIYNYDVEALKEKGTFPCIAYWGGAHFIVVDGFTKTHVIVNDPASGKIKLPLSKFIEGYSQYVLFFKPGENFQPGGKPESVLKFAKCYTSKLKKSILILGICSVFVALSGLVLPFISKYFYDKIIPYDVTLEQFLPFIILVGVFYLAQFIISAINDYLTYRANQKAATSSGISFMKKLLRLPLAFFEARVKGDVISRQQSSISVANNLITIFAPLFVQFVTMIFYLVVMFYFSCPLALIGVASVAFNCLASVFISKKRIELTRKSTRDKSKLYGTTVSSFEVMETIKSSGAEDDFFNKWTEDAKDASMAEYVAKSKDAYVSLIPSFIASALGTIIIGLGIYFVIKGSTTSGGVAFSLGIVTTFQGCYQAFSDPVSKLIKSQQKIAETRTDMERINDVYKYPDDEMIYGTKEKEIDYLDDKFDNGEENNKPTIDLSGDIELKNVTFGYAKLSKPILNGISFHIKPGQKIAFVGPSGCGKSTIAKLISGLYGPWSGEILFDGKNRNELSRNTFVSQLTVVDQDINLFPVSIRDNLTLWNNDITDESILKACNDAQVMDLINSKEGGLNHIVPPKADDMSGGQKQSLEIARGLAANPKILILDEATSALDAKTEDEIVKAIKKRNITCILIAHRLSTIRDADQIVVLDKGQIVEIGNHESLMKLNRVYANLVKND